MQAMVAYRNQCAGGRETRCITMFGPLLIQKTKHQQDAYDDPDLLHKFHRRPRQPPAIRNEGSSPA